MGASFEQYRVEVSLGGVDFTQVGQAGRGDRGDAAHLEHRFEPRAACFVRIVTDGCQDLTFPGFSRLVEVQVYVAQQGGVEEH